MQIKIDIKEIISQVLAHYPLCAHLQPEFEHQLNQEYENIQKSIRVVGINNVKTDSIQYAENCRNGYKDLLNPNLKANSSAESIEGRMAEMELYLKFHEAIIQQIENQKEKVSALLNPKDTRNLLKKSLPEKALEVLTEVEYKDAFFMLAKWNANRSEQLQSIISDNTYQTERSRILAWLYDFIDKLSNDELLKISRHLANKQTS